MNVITMQVLLHHFYDPTPYPSKSVAVTQAHAYLQHHQFIRPGNAINDEAFEVTERGRVMVNAMMNLPHPVEAWVMPFPDERKPT